MHTVSVTNGTTPVEVVPERRRRAIWIQNSSDTTIALVFDGSGVALTVDNGIELNAGERLWLEDKDNRGVYDKEIYAVHGAGVAKVLRVQEWLS